MTTGSADRPCVVVLAVRHGQAGVEGESYGPDAPLSPLGRRQAKAVGEAIARERRLAAVYTSPFPRALQTAAPLCGRLGRQPIVDERLAEYTMAPSSPEERADLVLWQSHHRGVEGGETLEDFGRRVTHFIEELCERHAGESVALFSHSGTIDALARWAVGLESHHPWQHDLPLWNASITELRIWPQGRVASGSPRYVGFERVGDVTHLGSELRTD